MKARKLGIIAIVIYFLWSFYLMYLPIDLFNLDTDSFTTLEKTFYLLASDLILMLALFLLYRKDFREDLIDFKKNHREYIDLGIKYWIIALIVMGTSNFLIQTFITTDIADNEEIVRTLLGSLTIYMGFSTCIYAPFVEETIFRKGIKDIMGFSMKFVITSGLIFGGLHVIGTMTSITDLVYIIPYSSVGIAFAYLYYKTRNIFSSMLMHFIHNTVFVVLELIILFM